MKFNLKKKVEAINVFFQKNKQSGLIIGFIAFLFLLPLSFTDFGYPSVTRCRSSSTS